MKGDMEMLTCPTCKELIGKPERDRTLVMPFCSERCKLIDLGAWVNEKYVVGHESSADIDEQDIHE